MTTSAKKISEFDKKKIWDEECQELVDTLRKKCIVYGIPFFWTACVKNTKTESVYMSNGVITGGNGIELYDDRLTRHLLVNVGFDAVPHEEKIEIQMDSPDDM